MDRVQVRTHLLRSLCDRSDVRTRFLGHVSHRPELLPYAERDGYLNAGWMALTDQRMHERDGVRHITWSTPFTPMGKQVMEALQRAGDQPHLPSILVDLVARGQAWAIPCLASLAPEPS